MPPSSSLTFISRPSRTKTSMVRSMRAANSSSVHGRNSSACRNGYTVRPSCTRPVRLMRRLFWKQQATHDDAVNRCTTLLRK
ncbi:hypothetical protein D3C72_1224200 [compost metagenome]